ncbi:MAG: GH25 family lysozyme [Ruminococcus sp.]
MNGIDISVYQGKIDGKKVRADKIEFAVLRVSDRNNEEDRCFAFNYEQCMTNNIPVGVYKFSYALTKAQAAEEADKTLQLIRNKDISCGVWLDLEWEEQRKLETSEVERILMY